MVRHRSKTMFENTLKMLNTF